MTGCHSLDSPTRVWPLTTLTLGLDITGHNDSTAHLHGTTFSRVMAADHPYPSLNLSDHSFVDIPMTADAVGNPSGITDLSLSLFLYIDTNNDGVLFEYMANGTSYFQMFIRDMYLGVAPLNMAGCDTLEELANEQLIMGWNHLALTRTFGDGKFQIFLKTNTVLAGFKICPDKFYIPVPGVLRIGASLHDSGHIEVLVYCVLLFSTRIKDGPMKDGDKHCANSHASTSLSTTATAGMGTNSTAEAGRSITNVVTTSVESRQTINTDTGIPLTAAVETILTPGTRRTSTEEVEITTTAEIERTTNTDTGIPVTAAVEPILTPGTRRTSTYEAELTTTAEIERTTNTEARETVATAVEARETTAVETRYDSTASDERETTVAERKRTTMEEAGLTRLAEAKETTTENIHGPTTTVDTIMLGETCSDLSALCLCHNITSFTEEESAIFMSNLLENIHVEMKNLSAYRRKFISVVDDRPAAQGIGYIGAFVMAGVFGCIVISDCVRFYEGFTGIFV